MCVADSLLQLCNEMASQETKSAAKIVCIPARDRYMTPIVDLFNFRNLYSRFFLYIIVAH